MKICKGSRDRGKEKREERQMERGREMVENRAEDTALFHSLALPQLKQPVLLQRSRYAFCLAFLP